MHTPDIQSHVQTLIKHRRMLAQGNIVSQESRKDTANMLYLGGAVFLVDRLLYTCNLKYTYM